MSIENDYWIPHSANECENLVAKLISQNKHNNSTPLRKPTIKKTFNTKTHILYHITLALCIASMKFIKREFVGFWILRLRGG